MKNRPFESVVKPWIRILIWTWNWLEELLMNHIENAIFDLLSTVFEILSNSRRTVKIESCSNELMVVFVSVAWKISFWIEKAKKLEIQP